MLNGHNHGLLVSISLVARLNYLLGSALFFLV